MTRIVVTALPLDGRATRDGSLAQRKLQLLLPACLPSFSKVFLFGARGHQA